MSEYFCEVHGIASYDEARCAATHGWDNRPCSILRIRVCRVDGRLIGHLYEERCDICSGRGSFVMPRVVNPSAVGNPNEEPVVAFAEIDPCPVCDGSGWRLRAQTDDGYCLTHGSDDHSGMWPLDGPCSLNRTVAVVVLEQGSNDVSV